MDRLRQVDNLNCICIDLARHNVLHGKRRRKKLKMTNRANLRNDLLLFTIQTRLLAFRLASCGRRVHCVTLGARTRIGCNTITIHTAALTMRHTFAFVQFESGTTSTLTRCNTFTQFTTLWTHGTTGTVRYRLVAIVACARIRCRTVAIATRRIAVRDAEFMCFV